MLMLNIKQTVCLNDVPLNGNRLLDGSWFKRLTLKMVPTYFWLNDERLYLYDGFKQSRGGRNRRVRILPEESYS